MESKRFSDYKEIGNISVEIGHYSSNGITMTLQDLKNPNRFNDSPTCEVTLEGIDDAEAKEFFNTVCRMLEEGSTPADVYDEVQNHAHFLRAAAAEGRKIQKQQNKTAEAALAATRFRGKEIVNGVQISVVWIDDKATYEIYVPKSGEDPIEIGQNKENAEAVFDYAKKIAERTDDPFKVQTAVSEFKRNGFREPAPKRA